ncbi:MAG: hypothetical protein ACRCUJ_02880, partial [Phocaeicola sp.]
CTTLFRLYIIMFKERFFLLILVLQVNLLAFRISFRFESGCKGNAYFLNTKSFCKFLFKKTPQCLKERRRRLLIKGLKKISPN